MGAVCTVRRGDTIWGACKYIRCVHCVWIVYDFPPSFVLIRIFLCRRKKKTREDTCREQCAVKKTTRETMQCEMNKYCRWSHPEHRVCVQLWACWWRGSIFFFRPRPRPWSEPPHPALIPPTVMSDSHTHLSLADWLMAKKNIFLSN